MRIYSKSCIAAILVLLLSAGEAVAARKFDPSLSPCAEGFRKILQLGHWRYRRADEIFMKEHPKPNADDLIAAIASMQGIDDGIQEHLITTFSNRIPDFTIDKLLDAVALIDNPLTVSRTIYMGFGAAAVRKGPEELKRALIAGKDSDAHWRQSLLNEYADKVSPSLTRAQIREYAGEITDRKSAADAIVLSYYKFRGKRAESFVEEMKALKEYGGERQVEFARRYSRLITDLDAASLKQATDAIDDPELRLQAIAAGQERLDKRAEVAAAVAAADRGEIPAPRPSARKAAPAPVRPPNASDDPIPVAPKTVAERSVAESAVKESELAKPVSSSLDQLKSMPGTEKIAAQLADVKELLEANRRRRELGLKTVTPMLHARFDGNPGTGKTTVARLYGEMLSELGFLENEAGKAMPVIEKGGADFVGSDAVEKMKKAIAEAKGGVLILDELYAADPAQNRFAKEASAVLLKAMEDDRDKFVVIATGYPKEMDDFTASNPGFRRRFAQKLVFEDYDDATLGKILHKFARESDYEVDDAAVAAAVGALSRERGKGFGNAGSVRNEFEAAVRRHSARIGRDPAATPAQLKRLTIEDFRRPVAPIDQKLAALDKLTGLEEVKRSVRGVVALLQLEKARQAQGLASQRPLLNAVFEGNPGTGKTTVARMYGEMLKDLGYISNGEFIEVKASDLIGDVIGASERKTRELLKRAKGNVLFIDEAYLLYRPDSATGGTFGRAALDTLVAEINADANQDMVVILAGYPREMASMMTANAGLSRRFPRNVNFADYDESQLAAILDKKVREKGFTLSESAEKAARAELKLRRSARDFGNAGEVENLIGSALLRQSERLAGTGKTDFTAAELRELRPGDFTGPRVSPQDVLRELDRLPGLASVKRALRDIADTNEEASLIGLDAHGLTGSVYAFEGHSPDEQKAVAETLGKLLHAQGVLPKAALDVADAAALKGQYVGESTSKTQRVLEAALGKTLLIRGLSGISDPGQLYEKEVLDTLAGFVEQNPGKLAVVFGGTPDELARFARLNPALARKIDHDVAFDRLALAEGRAHLAALFDAAGKKLAPAAGASLDDTLTRLLEEPGWGSAANLEQLKGKILLKQAVRTKRDPAADAHLISALDIQAAAPSIGGTRRLAAVESGPAASASGTEIRGQTREASRPAAPAAAAEASPAPAHAHAHDHEHDHAHAHDHDHDHDHAHAQDFNHAAEANLLAELGVHISEATRKLMLGIEDLIDRRDSQSIERARKAIQAGQLDPDYVLQLAQKLGRDTDARGLAELEREATAAIREMKDGARRLRELARENRKAKKLVAHYVCIVCGRPTCNYMPTTWFTEE